MPPTKLQRWLDLIAFLVARRFPVTIDQVMEGVPAYTGAWHEGDGTGRASARRAFERDKAELREAGIPIESVSFSINHGAEQLEGYRLTARDFHLPYLRLLRAHDAESEPSEDRAGDRATSGHEFAVREVELRAALDGLDRVSRLPSSPLAGPAASALRKLTFGLPPDFPAPSTTLYLDPPGVPDARDILEALADALLRRKVVTFRYHGIRRGQPTEREVEPYGLVFRGSRWYVVGRDREREDLRTFRVSRMAAVAMNARRPGTSDYEIPDDFDLAAYADREAWELGGAEEAPLRVRARFDFPRSLWAERNGHGEHIETMDDGSSVRDFEVADTGAFLRWLLPQGREVHVLLPGELREELRHLADRVAHVHGGPAR